MASGEGGKGPSLFPTTTTYPPRHLAAAPSPQRRAACQPRRSDGPAPQPPGGGAAQAPRPGWAGP